MPLSQKSWEEIMKVVLLKMGEKRHTLSLNPDDILLVLKDNWELVTSKKACEVFLAEKDLAAKKAAQKEAQTQLKTLTAEIEKLEATR